MSKYISVIISCQELTRIKINARKLARKKEMQALQSQINIFSQFINPLPHTSLNIFRAHIFWSVSVDVAFYLMLGFGTQGHGFVSTSLFWRVWVLSLQLCYLGVVGLTPLFWGGCGFESFLGGGSFFNLFVLGGGAFTLIS